MYFSNWRSIASRASSTDCSKVLLVLVANNSACGAKTLMSACLFSMLSGFTTLSITSINEMVFDTLSLLDKENHFYLLNTYSLGFSSLIIENIISDNLSKTSFNKVQPEYGELYIPSTTEQKLPLGVYCRF